MNYCRDCGENFKAATCQKCEYCASCCICEKEKGKMETYEDAIKVVLEIAEEMQQSSVFDAATLEELKQRIV